MSGRKIPRERGEAIGVEHFGILSHEMLVMMQSYSILCFIAGAGKLLYWQVLILQ